MNRRLLAAATFVVAWVSLPAAAQFQKPEDAIKYRQSALTVMSTHFGRVAAMAAGRIPYDAKAASDNLAIAVMASRLPFVAFVEGSDKGLPNRAKPEVWSQNAKFKELAEKMQGELAKLDTAAKAGTLDALKPAVAATGAACKACHDDFRAEKYSAN